MGQNRVIGQTRVRVVLGDIRTEPSDALITAINSYKEWSGGIDGAIQSVAGDHFHTQAARQELSDLVTVVALGGNGSSGAFKNVVFVVDDLQSRLREVVKAGLEAASEAGFQTVTIPGIRLGVGLGLVEKSLDEVYTELDAGVTEFLTGHTTSLRDVKFVFLD